MTAPGAAGSVWGANVWGADVWGVNVWGRGAFSYADIAQRIHVKLAATTAVTDLVDDRIYVGDLPQRVTYPCVTFKRITETFERAFNTTPGNRTTKFMVTFWSTGRYDSVDGRNAVKAALSRFRDTVDTPFIDDTLIQNKRDDINHDRKESPLYQAMSDITVFSRPGV